jgi:predicted Zn-dependent peptidase
MNLTFFKPGRDAFHRVPLNTEKFGTRWNASLPGLGGGRFLFSFLFALLAILLFPSCTHAQVQTYKEIKYPGLPPFTIPKPEVYTMKNGLKVFLMEDHELPLVSVTARVRTGSNYEPAEKTGLAGLMGAVQRSGGSTRQTGDQIDDYLAARAASVETSVGEDAGFASMNCLKPDFDDVFKVFVEVLRTPAFAQDKLDIAKVAENSGIARRNDDVGGIAAREIGRLVYGPDSPLTRNTEYATIAAITRDDLVAWHKKYYQPNSILLGVVGDFKSSEMKQKLEAALGDWAAGPEFKAPEVPFRKEPAPGYYFIEKSDVNQANIVLGHLGIETKNPDYFAVQVMNEVLGGGFASRLFSNVRSKKGLAYSVYGSVGSGFFEPGMFRAGLQTKSSTAIKGIQAIKTEIDEIISKPATDDELKRAKDAILNSFVFHYDSKGKILGQQMTYAFYGLPEDFLDQYRANIEKVTIADVSRVAKKYVHPDQLAVLVVGKAADFDQPLQVLGKVTTVDITIPAPPDTAPKAEKSAATIAAGKEIWSRVIKALGGDALKKTDAFRVKGSVALKMGGQSMALKQETTIVFPDKIRQSVITPIGTQTVVLDGEVGFMMAGDKVQSLPAEMVQDQVQEMRRGLENLLRYNDDPGLEIVAAGEEKVDGADCKILSASYKGTQSRIWVGADGKVVKQSYAGKNPFTRAPGTVEVAWSDYRPEGPLLVAHKQVQSMDGKEIMSTTVDEFEINPKVDPDQFKKPAGQ